MRVQGTGEPTRTGTSTGPATDFGRRAQAPAPATHAPVACFHGRQHLVHCRHRFLLQALSHHPPVAILPDLHLVVLEQQVAAPTTVQLEEADVDGEAQVPQLARPEEAKDVLGSQALDAVLSQGGAVGWWCRRGRQTYGATRCELRNAGNCTQGCGKRRDLGGIEGQREHSCNTRSKEAAGTRTPTQRANAAYHGVRLSAARLPVGEHGASASAEHVVHQRLHHVRVHVLVGVILVERLR